ncbi:MAG: hypothetical protein ACC613_07745 [Synergistales bacterium]
MRTKTAWLSVIAVFLFFVLPFGAIWVSKAISAEYTVDTSYWPTWPSPDSRINGLEVWEPATFLSIGRDVISWVYFGTRPSDDGFVSADLNFLVKKTETDSSIHTFEPNISTGDSLFVVPGNSAILSPTNTEILTGLRGTSALPVAVFPEYKDAWLMTNTTSIPNEHFRNDQAWLNLDDWRSFLRGNYSASFKYADTGHAPPQIVWDVDPWLEAFLANQYVAPPTWANRVVGIISTNQGTLQGYEVYPDEATPYAERKWVIVPNPAFRQSIYQIVQKKYTGVLKRLTLLDGPFTVRDIEIDGGWKRILVGTSGLGTKQYVKPKEAWGNSVLGQPDLPKPQPTLSEPGRVFGVYAYDITSLAVSPTTSTLKPSWSVSNIYFQHSGKSFNDYFPENDTGTSKTSYAAYSGIKFSTSKPLIGYTKSGGTRTWHSVILGVDIIGGVYTYKWLDVDPKDGKVLNSGVLTRGGINETIPSISDKETYLSPEEIETLYPSRILAAFPPPSYNPQEPLLSSIYIYLSNGALYRWNLNDGTAPTWIATFQNDKGYPMCPLTDFDISYLNGSTYLAATVTFTYNGASAHETSGLIVVNLTEVESMEAADRVFRKAPPGQDGTVASSKEDHIMMVQLQGTQGSYTTQTKEVMASPVFIKEKLYLAYYEMAAKKKINMSRLYTFYFATMMGEGNVQHLEEYTGDNEDTAQFYDLEDQRAANMFIDSKGNLVLIDEQGNALVTLPTGLEYAGVGSGSAASPFNKMSVVYWKKL